MLLGCDCVPTRPDVSGAHFAVASQSSPGVAPFAGHLCPQLRQHAGEHKRQRHRLICPAFGRRVSRFSTNLLQVLLSVLQLLWTSTSSAAISKQRLPDVGIRKISRECLSLNISVQGAPVPPKPAPVEPETAPPAPTQTPQPAAKATTSTQDPPQADVLLELKNVYKSFGSKPILRGANMTIRRGEAVGIIGGSGTGKSTTLRIMAGLLMPDVVCTAD